MDEFKYFAFISYSWKDKKEARWLQRELEGYSIPVTLKKENPELPERIRPVFRDVSDLDLGVLPENISKALQMSRFMIVLCSPDSAGSKWVNLEIRDFCSCVESIGDNPRDRIIPVIVRKPQGGKGDASGYSECFPDALTKLSAEQELLAANYFEAGRKSAFIKIVARMLGISFDTLWQRNRRRLRKRRTLGILAILLLTLITVGGFLMLRTAIHDARVNKILNAAQLSIETHDPVTAERLLLTLVPENDPHERPEYLSRAFYLLREAEYDYRHSGWIVPGTADDLEWQVLEDRYLASFHHLIDLDNNKVLHHLSDEKPDIYTYSPDGRFLYYSRQVQTETGNYSQEVLKYDVLSGSVKTLFSFDGTFSCLSVLDDGILGIGIDKSFLEYGEETGPCAFLIDTETGELLNSFSHPRYGKDDSFHIEEMSFSEDGRLVLLYGSDRICCSFDPDSSELVEECPYEKKITPLESAARNLFSFDSLCVRKRGAIARWDYHYGLSIKPATLQERFHLSLENRKLTVYDCFFPDSTFSIKCDYPSLKMVDTPIMMDDKILLHNPSSSSLYNRILVLDLKARQLLLLDDQLIQMESTSFLWSRNGAALISQTNHNDDHWLSVYPLNPSALSVDNLEYESSVLPCPISGKGSFIVLGWDLYNVETGNVIYSPGCYSLSYAFSPEEHLYVCHGLQGLTFVNTETGEVSVSNTEVKGWFDRFSRDGNYIGLQSEGGYQVYSVPEDRVIFSSESGSAFMLNHGVCDRETIYTFSPGKKALQFYIDPDSFISKDDEDRGYNREVSPDGEYIMIEGWKNIYILDSSNGVVIGRYINSDYEKQTIRKKAVFRIDMPCSELIDTLRLRYKGNTMTREETRDILNSTIMISTGEPDFL